MAETPETNKPDFRNGFPILDLNRCGAQRVDTRDEAPDRTCRAVKWQALTTGPTQ